MASRNISISLPEEMIRQATQLASQEHRTLSELFREAFRMYRAQTIQSSPRSPQSTFKDEELNRITRELRAELDAEHSTS